MLRCLDSHASEGLGDIISTMLCVWKLQLRFGMESFRCIDWLLCLSGCKIFVYGSSSKIMNGIMAVLVVSSALIMVVVYAYLYYDIERYQLLLIAVETAFLGDVAFVCIMNRNRKILRLQIARVLKALPVQATRCMTIWSVVLSLVCLLQFTKASGGVVFIHTLWHTEMSDIVMHSVPDVFIAMGSSFHGAAVYLFIVWMMYYWELEFFNNVFDKLTWTMETNLQLRDMRGFVKRLNKDRIMMNEVKKKLIKSMSFLPLIWFLHLFLFIAGVVVFAQRNEKKNVLVDVLADGGNICFELLVVIVLMISVDQVNDLIKTKSQEVVDLLSQHAEGFLVEIPLRDFHDRCTSFDFSVSSMFVLNKQLFLGFVSSLLTFTTLFIQMANGIYTLNEGHNSTQNSAGTFIPVT